MQTAELTVQRLVSSWRGAPPVNVVDSVSDLPVKAPGDVRGMLRRGVAWVVRDTQPLRYVPQTVAHEVIGHHAMRSTLGASWRSFMGALQGGLRAGDSRLGIVRAHVRETYVDDGGSFQLNSVQEADEITAYVAELGFDGDSGRLQVNAPVRMRLQAAVGHFYRETLFMDRPVCFDQLVGMLLAAEHRLRHGGPIWGLGYRLRRWYAPSMPKFDPHARPMSLDESQSLLAAEASRRQDWEEWKAMGMFARAILCGLAAVGGVVYWVVLIFGGLGNLFR